MFSLNKCLVRACHNLSISTIGEDGNIAEDKSYCLDHSPNPGKIQQDIFKYINTHEKIVGLNASGMTFLNMDLSARSNGDTRYFRIRYLEVR